MTADPDAYMRNRLRGIVRDAIFGYNRRASLEFAAATDELAGTIVDAIYAAMAADLAETRAKLADAGAVIIIELPG